MRNAGFPDGSAGASSAQGISFRPIRPKRDLEFLSRVYKSTRLEELALSGWTPGEIDSFLQSQFETQHKYYIQSWPDAEYLVILLGKLKVGRLYKEERQDEIRVIDIAILPQHRGKGIGSQIMRWIANQAESRGKPVRIHVEKQNPAQRLYRRLGFKRISGGDVYDLMELVSGAQASVASG